MSDHPEDPYEAADRATDRMLTRLLRSAVALGALFLTVIVLAAAAIGSSACRM
jgi:preprotein translocase subunit SecY